MHTQCSPKQAPAPLLIAREEGYCGIPVEITFVTQRRKKAGSIGLCNIYLRFRLWYETRRARHERTLPFRAVVVEECFLLKFLSLLRCFTGVFFAESRFPKKKLKKDHATECRFPGVSPFVGFLALDHTSCFCFFFQEENQENIYIR